MKLYEQQIVFKSWLVILKFNSDTGVLIFPQKEKNSNCVIHLEGHYEMELGCHIFLTH